MSIGDEQQDVPNSSEGKLAAESGPAKERTARPKQSAKAHLFVTITHWAMVILLTLALLSGMRIGWGFVESPLGGEEGVWASFLNSIAPKGSLFGINLIDLHVSLALFMIAVSVVYAIYMFRSRASKRLRVTAKDMEKLQAGLASKGFWRNKAALWSANLIVYWVAFVFVIVLVGTGLAMYFLNSGLADFGPMEYIGGYSTVRLLHALVAYLLIPYTILHSLLQWFFGRFWSIFKAQLYRPHMRAGAIGLVFGAVWFGWLYAWNETPMSMTVPRLPDTVAAPVLDGVESEEAWKHAPSKTIRTVKGVNNLDPYVDVRVKAIHDGKNIYFRFHWKDQDASFKRFPLRKTVDGWEVLQTAFDTWDENVYYEDKLSVYVTDVTNGSCATSCHLGVGPHAEKGDKHGLHYTTGGEIADLWHWKSVRSNNMAGDDEPGWADDQHIGPPTPMPTKLKAEERYAGGYNTDPQPKGAGYRYNFKKVDPKGKIWTASPRQGEVGGTEFTKTLVQPIVLPRTLDLKSDPNPKTSEEKSVWWIRDQESLPYDENHDKFPVGTMIPNIIIAPFQGDRADVRAKGKWKNGYWTLEISRPLDTGSKFDVPFTFAKPVYISLAAYNRTQTRHSEHIRPLQLILQDKPAMLAKRN